MIGLPKLISIVFKTLISTVVLLVVVNLVWNISTILSAHYRIVNSTFPLLMSIADNNRLTAEMEASYNTIFANIRRPNGVPSGTVRVLEFDATSLGAMRAGGEYGDIIEIQINAVFGAQQLSNDTITNADADLGVGTDPGTLTGFNEVTHDVASDTYNLPWYTVPVTYVYQVPCLRYYK